MKFRKGFAYLLALVMVLFAACAGPMNGGLDLDGTMSGDLPAEAVLQAQQYLADQLGVTINEIQIVETERVEWPDACLGLSDEGEACAQVVTPGWRAVYEVNGQQYELRTDETGNIIRSPDDLQ